MGFCRRKPTRTANGVCAVTDLGKAMGIIEEKRHSNAKQMDYTVLVYGAEMQRFIIGHLPEIAAAIEETTEETENTES